MDLTNNKINYLISKVKKLESFINNYVNPSVAGLQQEDVELLAALRHAGYTKDNLVTMMEAVEYNTFISDRIAQVTIRSLDDETDVPFSQALLTGLGYARLIESAYLIYREKLVTPVIIYSKRLLGNGETVTGINSRFEYIEDDTTFSYLCYYSETLVFSLKYDKIYYRQHYYSYEYIYFMFDQETGQVYIPRLTGIEDVNSKFGINLSVSIDIIESSGLQNFVRDLPHGIEMYTVPSLNDINFYQTDFLRREEINLYTEAIEVISENLARSGNVSMVSLFGGFVGMAQTGLITKNLVRSATATYTLSSFDGDFTSITLPYVLAVGTDSELLQVVVERDISVRGGPFMSYNQDDQTNGCAYVTITPPVVPNQDTYDPVVRTDSLLINLGYDTSSATVTIPGDNNPILFSLTRVAEDISTTYTGRIDCILTECDVVSVGDVSELTISNGVNSETPEMCVFNTEIYRNNLVGKLECPILLGTSLELTDDLELIVTRQVTVSGSGRIVMSVGIPDMFPSGNNVTIPGTFTLNVLGTEVSVTDVVFTEKSLQNSDSTDILGYESVVYEFTFTETEFEVRSTAQLGDIIIGTADQIPIFAINSNSVVSETSDNLPLVRAYDFEIRTNTWFTTVVYDFQAFDAAMTTINPNWFTIKAMGEASTIIRRTFDENLLPVGEAYHLKVDNVLTRGLCLGFLTKKGESLIVGNSMPFTQTNNVICLNGSNLVASDFYGPVSSNTIAYGQSVFGGTSNYSRAISADGYAAFRSTQYIVRSYGLYLSPKMYMETMTMSFTTGGTSNDVSIILLPTGTTNISNISQRLAGLISDVDLIKLLQEDIIERVVDLEARVDYIEEVLTSIIKNLNEIVKTIQIIIDQIEAISETIDDIIDSINQSNSGGSSFWLSIAGTIVMTIGGIVTPFFPLVGTLIIVGGISLSLSAALIEGDIASIITESISLAVAVGTGMYKFGKRIKSKISRINTSSLKADSLTLSSDIASLPKISFGSVRSSRRSLSSIGSSLSSTETLPPRYSELSSALPTSSPLRKSTSSTTSISLNDVDGSTVVGVETSTLQNFTMNQVKSSQYVEAVSPKFLAATTDYELSFQPIVRNEGKTTIQFGSGIVYGTNKTITPEGWDRLNITEKINSWNWITVSGIAVSEEAVSNVRSKISLSKLKSRMMRRPLIKTKISGLTRTLSDDVAETLIITEDQGKYYYVYTAPAESFLQETFGYTSSEATKLIMTISAFGYNQEKYAGLYSYDALTQLLVHGSNIPDKNPISSVNTSFEGEVCDSLTAKFTDSTTINDHIDKAMVHNFRTYLNEEIDDVYDDLSVISRLSST